MPNPPGIAVDWENWTAKMRSTLVFIRRDHEVLLIRKKRGLGAGKINGPGGKVDEGETVEETAARETEEEVGLVPTHMEPRGELRFQFADGLSIHCTVFLTEHFDGELRETEEAVPMWVAVDAIPYEEMWEDDQYWLPQVLEGETFEGYFTFEGDKMLSRDIRFDSDGHGDAAGDGGTGEEPRQHRLDDALFLHLQRVVESLLVASESPLTVRALLGTLKKVADDQEALAAEAAKEGEAFTGPEVSWVKNVDEVAIEAAIEALKESYDRDERSFIIAERAAGHKIFTRPGFGLWVRGLFPDQKPKRLRPPALETLAIIAYRQPLTKADIEAVRGVNVDGVLKMLLDRNLVQIGGRADSPGRPLLYETTDLFLDHFGIRSVDELPNADELRKVELPRAQEVQESSGESEGVSAAGEGEEAESEGNPEGSGSGTEQGDIPPGEGSEGPVDRAEATTGETVEEESEASSAEEGESGEEPVAAGEGKFPAS